MKSLFSTLFFFSILFSTDYKIENSKVTYYGDHYLHKWEGFTNDIRGIVQYDEKTKNYSCSIVVPISTFSSGNDSRDSNMLIYCKAFDFPNISFESKSIQVNKNSLEIEGSIEFAGEKKAIKTTAQLNNLGDNQFSIEGEFEIMLSEFDITRPSLLFVKMEDRVLITYSIKGVMNE